MVNDLKDDIKEFVNSPLIITSLILTRVKTGSGHPMLTAPRSTLELLNQKFFKFSTKIWFLTKNRRLSEIYNFNKNVRHLRKFRFLPKVFFQVIRRVTKRSIFDKSLHFWQIIQCFIKLWLFIKFSIFDWPNFGLFIKFSYWNFCLQ